MGHAYEHRLDVSHRILNSKHKIQRPAFVLLRAFNTLFALIHHAANMIGCVVRKLYLFLKEGITF